MDWTRPGASPSGGAAARAHQWTAALRQSGLVNPLVIGASILPAAPDDPLPFEGQRPHRRVMGRAPLPLLQVIRRRPSTPQHALLGVFMKTLPVKLRTQIAPVDVTTASTLLGHRRHARVLLQARRRVEAFPLSAHAGQQARPQYRPGSR